MKQKKGGHKGGQGVKAPYDTYNTRVVKDASHIVDILNEYVKQLYLDETPEEEINQKVAQLEAELLAKIKKVDG